MTEILLLWPGNGFTLSFYLQTISGSRAKRERARQRERGRKKEERVEIVQSRARRYHPKSSSPRSSAKIVRRHHRHRANRDRAKRLSRSRSREMSRFDDFFLGFICVLRNEWYYIFVWQSRKCEKMWVESERKREREKERRESRDRPKPSSPRSSKASIAKIVRRRHRHRANRDRMKRRSRSREMSGFDDFFLGFVCVLRNEWYYIFVWQPRKCEKNVSNK